MNLRFSINAFFFVLFIIWVFISTLILHYYDTEIIFKWVNTNNNTLLDYFFNFFSFWGTFWGIAIIGLLSLLYKPYRNIKYIITLIIACAIPPIITQWVKHSVNAPRPQLIFGDKEWLHKLESWDTLYYNSFPSGHTTGIFSIVCFIVCTLPKSKQYFAMPLFFLALLVAYSRVYLAAHFYEDVFVGSIIGTTVAFSIGFISYNVLKIDAKTKL